MAPALLLTAGAAVWTGSAAAAAGKAAAAADRGTAVSCTARGGSYKGTIASPDPRKPAINWVAAKWELDYQTHHILMHDATICQGDMIVTADEIEAAGTDAKNSHWLLTGNVHVKSENQGELHSERATLEFGNGLLAHAVVTGNPAQFEQTQSSTGVLAHGHADTIDYDVQAGIVRLTDDAWLSDGRQEITAPELVYNVRAKQIEGTGNPSGGRVHATVQPRPEKAGKSGPSSHGGPGNTRPGAPGSNSTTDTVAAGPPKGSKP